MNLDNLHQEILAIEYPGIVKNVDYMLETLGGLTNISKVVSFIRNFTQSESMLFNRFSLQANDSEKKRLDLKFRPNNVFSKPIFGDMRPTTGLLVKVKRRRRKGEQFGETETEILGTIKSIIKFDGICDYQYLPIAKDLKTNETKCIYDEIVPSELVDSNWLT